MHRARYRPTSRPPPPLSLSLLHQDACLPRLSLPFCRFLPPSSPLGVQYLTIWVPETGASRQRPSQGSHSRPSSPVATALPCDRPGLFTPASHTSYHSRGPRYGTVAVSDGLVRHPRRIRGRARIEYMEIPAAPAAPSSPWPHRPHDLCHPTHARPSRHKVPQASKYTVPPRGPAQAANLSLICATHRLECRAKTVYASPPLRRRALPPRFHKPFTTPQLWRHPWRMRISKMRVPRAADHAKIHPGAVAPTLKHVGTAYPPRRKRAHHPYVDATPTSRIPSSTTAFLRDPARPFG